MSEERDPSKEAAGAAVVASDASASPATDGLKIVVVTGRSGAGRTTAINALEDLGFETIDTPPLDFVPAMAARMASEGPRRLAIGVDARTAGFSREAVAEMLRALHKIEGARIAMLFLDGSDDALRKRYMATRRRHPLAPNDTVDAGLERDRARMLPLRELADLVVDTSTLTPRDLRRVVQQRFGEDDAPGLTIAITSFSYRNGLPPDADLVFDCRFLRNPFYDEKLRSQDGRDPAVAQHVAEDPRFPAFLEKVVGLTAFLLPAFAAEGKSYLTIAFGCTGGRHRSVAMAEATARELRALGWRLALRHREAESGAAAPDKTLSTDAA